MAWSPPQVTIYRERPKIYPCYGDCNPRSSRQPSWGSEFSIDSWQLEEIPSGGGKKQKESGKTRSEEGRVGEEGRTRGAPGHLKKKKKKKKEENKYKQQ